MKNLFLLIGLLFIAGASQAQKGDWINPVFECVAKAGERATKQHPYERFDERVEGGNRKGMSDFNDRMQKRFSDSKLDSTNALQVYEWLAQDGFIRDESYGMPSPGQKKKPKFNSRQLQKRVAIRKVKKSVYEILYYRYGCGTTYSHLSIEFSKGKITKKKVLESWSGSYPC